ncbi:MAG: hypothetical protein AB7O24_31345 [Kofleriaceae bacterium]
MPNPMMNQLPMMGMPTMPQMPGMMPGMNPMMSPMMNPMMGMMQMMPMMMGMMQPVMCKMSCEMTKDGLTCKMTPVDPGHMDLMKDRVSMMMSMMQAGVPWVMFCGGMPMVMGSNT